MNKKVETWEVSEEETGKERKTVSGLLRALGERHPRTVTPAAASGPPGWRGRITVWLHLVEALSRAPLHHEYRRVFFIASVVFVLCCAKSSEMIDNMGLFK